ncbi:uncharacterized protein [Oryza sativa Japonica Group]|uniref:Expressed protein n=6 Tax=Oryza TaxID=4527 RepID=Q2R103_ORYSJ|nr:uncharacterized protein LOC9266969 [Oryza sativa Japonica Group]XP_052136797.1 uncharacterized protein LOC127755177 [Oryza glaberrima]ABA94869.1 expressed protein [Oryza sativa Japonica Group]KAF2911731.1 hypothetical protein DAI22_11g203000 [Oryza sativa Japonica Group]
MDDDKLALAVAHVAFPDGDLFTFPDLEPHGAGAGGEGGTAGYLAACGDRLLLADDEYGVLRLTSPLTGDTVVLPGLVIGGGVSVRDVPVVLADEAAPSGTAPRRWRDSEEMSVLKLVVCPVGGGGGGLVVAAIVGREHFAKVALCTPEGFVWSISARDRWRWYDDMAFHGGRLYALTQAEDLLAFDVVDAGDGEPVVTGVERVVRSSVDALDVEDTRMHYLVTSLDGALLMVRREMADAGSTDGFEVFEADLAASRWVEVGGLGAGGEALFVGRLCSRAVRAPDDGDQIFFLDDTDGLSFRWELQPRPPYQVAAYDMVRRTFSMLMWKKPLEDGNTPVTWLFPDDDDDDDRVTK